jgi:RNA polymerase sigma-70 factor (ECF subfamily)
MFLNPGSNQINLLREFSQGCEQAFTKLFNRYKDIVYCCSLKITKSKSFSQKVVQYVFLKVWCEKETFTDMAHFENYIFIMARNHIFDMLKKNAWERTLINIKNYNAIVLDLADLSLEQKQFKSVFNKIVKQLPPQQQQVYRMVKEQDLNYQQIAELLDISPLSVKKHMEQALKLIRIKLIRHIKLS